MNLRHAATLACLGLMAASCVLPLRADATAGFSDAVDAGHAADPVVTVRHATERGLERLSRLRTESIKENGPASLATQALAGIAYLEAGNTPDKGAYAADLRDCTAAVLSGADDAGLLAGSKMAPMYNHGVCTRFLAMQFKVTHDAKVKDALAKAVALTIHAQNTQGGWRYLPTSNDSDVSATACQVIGLRAAVSAGIEVDKAVFERAARYLISCQNADGGFSYMAESKSQSGISRSAAAVAALIACSIDADREAIDRGMAYLVGFSTKGAAAAHFYYGAYYAAQTFLVTGGDRAKSEYAALRDAILGMQKSDGTWSGEINDAYATATALAILLSDHQP